MIFLLYAVAPFLIANAVSGLISRRRPSFPYALFQGLFASAACLAGSALLLLPNERIKVVSSGGMLALIIGKTAVVFCLAVSLAAGVLFGLLLREQPAASKRRTHPIPGIPALVLFFILLFLSQAYFWAQRIYGNTTLDEIIFYLNMPLEGTTASFLDSILYSVLLPSLLCFVPITLLFIAPVRKPKELLLLRRIRLPLFPMRLPMLLVWPILLIWAVLLFRAGSEMLQIDSFISGILHPSAFIEENYVDPESVAITFPEEKRNLITVYLESFEHAAQDTASGGVLYENLMPDMTRIAQENISFSRNNLITGASAAPRCTWTMSGLIAQTAGLPLLNIINEAANVATLLPGATALGDILRDEGYNLMFMAGSDFTFGGRRAYFHDHGDYEVYDLFTAREEEGRLPFDYYESWGFEDVKLYEYAKEKILELAQKDEPFHFAMLTADTHTPGYHCPLCPSDYQMTFDDAFGYADVIRCTSAQFNDFLAWFYEQEFSENTTLVVTGDHPTMQTYFYSKMLDEEKADARIPHYVYNAFINSAADPVQEENRLFTTMDFFPTVLASIGATIEGERLGLGTNLFSDHETLTEQYGEEYVFAELEKKSPFYEQTLLFSNDH